MITLVTGTLLERDLASVEVLTSGGVGYTLAIPLSTFEALPRAGEAVRLHTHLVVKEDGWQLFGFATVYERNVFVRLLNAKGFGPQLSLNMLSALSAERLVRAIRDRDVAVLQQVKGLGKKKAEQLLLDLADKMMDLQRSAGSVAATGGAGTDDALRALQSLGFGAAEAEAAIRAAIDAGEGKEGTAALVRAALARANVRK
jgi:holliday junction DNA helicase RuvA